MFGFVIKIYNFILIFTNTWTGLFLLVYTSPQVMEVSVYEHKIYYFYVTIPNYFKNRVLFPKFI